MHAIGTTLLVVAVLAAPSGARAGTMQLRPIGGDTLPGAPVEPPELPLAPPPLPEVHIPDVPDVVPTQVPTPRPGLPEAPAAPSVPQAPGGADQSGPPQRVSTPTTAGVSTPTAHGSGKRAPVSRRARTTSPRAASRPVRRQTTAPARARPRRTGGSEPRRADTRPVLTRPASSRAGDPAGPESLASRVTGDVGGLVRTLPPAILWALLGIGAIALGLAGNAFWQSRQRAGLEAQRAELLDDIGLLSSALLPCVPGGLDGVAVSAAYRPADGPAAGGDFYDVFAIDGQRICVLLGDVSGHGRESVSHAALARYTLRTLLAAGHRPGEALARADGLLERDLRPHFVTVIAGVFDPATGELTYAKAGHAPPIVLGAAHDPDAETPAPPIGLGVGVVWPEYRMRLCDGVSVCLFTDGLEDARVGDARVGRGEVARLLAAQDIPDAGRLLGDLEDFADRMSDDSAAVVLSRR